MVALVAFSCSQEKKEYTIAFYNVENLFDTINDPATWDDDFTPEGKLEYTTKRYQNKLVNLSNVLSSIDKNNLPAIIGLCEVENRSVLDALIGQDKLKDAEYGIAHTDSPDARGIDCALLYKKNEFKYLNHNTIGIHFKTRDILHVQGILGAADTLDIFVNHWPSRIGGIAKSEKNRVFVAEQLKLAVNKLQEKNPKAKIIIMGDFNDEPNNKSTEEALAATNNTNTSNPKALYNLMYDLKLQGKGTYNYKGNWNMLDNLIVSNSLISNTDGIHTNHKAGRIFTEEWICYKNSDGLSLPSRSYAGPRYFGGYSDHFPVYFQLSR
jgi:endonuclease/exonuclease/phosphatase family metal-dependent hydrolase